MKIILTIVLALLSATKFFACSCTKGNFAREYLQSEVVAIVNIENTFGDREYERNGFSLRSYKASLNFEKIYKGKAFKTLDILGSTTYADSGACEILVRKGEKYLIIVNKNKNGEYFVSECSIMSSIGKEDIKRYDIIFPLLEKHKDESFYQDYVNYQDISKRYDEKNEKIISDFSKLNISLKNKIGIYKVTANNAGYIEKIIPIEKIGRKEKQIQEIIKKNFQVYQDFEIIKGEYLILVELN